MCTWCLNFCTFFNFCSKWMIWKSVIRGFDDACERDKKITFHEARAEKNTFIFWSIWITYLSCHGSPRITWKITLEFPKKISTIRENFYKWCCVPAFSYSHKRLRWIKCVPYLGGICAMSGIVYQVYLVPKRTTVWNTIP